MTQPPREPPGQGSGGPLPPPRASPPQGSGQAGGQPGANEPLWLRTRYDGAHAASRRTNGPLVAAAAGAAIILVLALITVVTLAGNDTELAQAGYEGGPNPGASAPPPVTGSSTDDPGNTTASPERRTRATSSGHPGSTMQSGPHKVFTLGDHPLLQNPDAGLANRACPLPEWQSTPAGARAFFTAARQCLDAAWRPLLERYDLPFHPPELHFPQGDNFQTECGTIQVGIATAAYYCENNLYVPYHGLQTQRYGTSPGVYLALFAHEYGHHVQELAGIMDAAWKRIYAEGQNSEDGLEMARRKELQAQCFSGMFLGAHVDRGGSITRQMYERAWADQATRGDDNTGTHNHGSNANYAQWWRTGAQDNRIAECNTFTASSDAVS